MYFTKKNEYSYLVTSAEYDFPIVSFTGDYMSLWDIIQGVELPPETTLLAPVTDSELSHLKPFFEFLDSAEFIYEVDERRKQIILKSISFPPKGTFTIVEVEELSEVSIFAACSFNGTDAYSGAECTTNGINE
jgi:hypothetical protein